MDCNYDNKMMESVCTPEMLVHFYETTQHHIPQGCSLHEQ